MIDETLAWYTALFPGEPQLSSPLDEEKVVTLATFDAGAEEVVASVGLAAIDTGLETEGTDVRVEVFTVTRPGQEWGLKVIDAISRIVKDVGPDIPAQPGTPLPDLGDIAFLPGEVTARHGLFVAPFVWGGQVPNLPRPDNLTLMLQLIMLTESEWAIFTEQGIEALQVALADGQVDLQDWQRP